MSSKPPIENSNCPQACGTANRLLCFVKTLACKAQELVDPLCEIKQSALSQEDETRFKALIFLVRTAAVGVSESLIVDERAATLGATYDGFRSYVRTARANEQFLSPEALRLLAIIEDEKPWLTWLNRTGLVFAYGTSCPCCLGFRLLFALIVGYLLGKLL